MLRPLAETGEELDGEQVEKPFDEPRQAVFRAAELPRPMMDDHFAHAETAGGRQHRHEAVQLAVEPHFVRAPRGGSTSCRNCDRAAARPSSC